jgi:hypothetical protein
MRLISRAWLALSVAVVLALFAVGCGAQQTEGEKKDQQGTKDGTKKDGKDKGGEPTTHEGWWCDEHGIPEAECIICSEKLKKEAKERGDWCKHNRARSQCFACNPDLKKVYADRYREKFGKEPPPVTDND